MRNNCVDRWRPEKTSADCAALEGTTEYPHFDRTAFKVDRTYVTLGPDGKSANFKFTPDEQALKCTVAADAFAPIDNAWGRQGWTVGTLKALSVAELKAALAMAHAHGMKPKKTAERQAVQVNCSAVMLAKCVVYQTCLGGCRLVQRSSRQEQGLEYVEVAITMAVEDCFWIDVGHERALRKIRMNSAPGRECLRSEMPESYHVLSAAELRSTPMATVDDGACPRHQGEVGEAAEVKLLCFVSSLATKTCASLGQ